MIYCMEGNYSAIPNVGYWIFDNVLYEGGFLGLGKDIFISVCNSEPGLQSEICFLINDE